MDGISFYFHLRFILAPDVIVGDQHDYTFVKWMSNGGLQFKINDRQKKTIPAELIIVAHHAFSRGVLINDNWVNTNGHTDWCFDEVLNFLINNFNA